MMTYFTQLIEKSIDPCCELRLMLVKNKHEVLIVPPLF